MKVIILIMLILMSKNIALTIKGLFISTDKKVAKFKHLVENDLDKMIEKYGQDELEEGFLAFYILATVCITIFYILSAIYVKSIIFTIFSTFYVIKSWKYIPIITDWLKTRDYDILVRNMTGKLYNIVWLGYIGYLVYFLVINW